MYWNPCSTSARRMPGEWPGGWLGFSGSLTYTNRPLAASIMPTQLVAERGMPVTRTGRIGSVTCAARDHHRHQAWATSARPWPPRRSWRRRSEEHTSELQSRENLVCRLLLEKKKKKKI